MKSHSGAPIPKTRKSRIGAKAGFLKDDSKHGPFLRSSVAPRPAKAAALGVAQRAAGVAKTAFENRVRRSRNGFKGGHFNPWLSVPFRSPWALFGQSREHIRKGGSRLARAGWGDNPLVSGDASGIVGGEPVRKNKKPLPRSGRGFIESNSD